MATPTTHAFISASNAHRWLNCTAAPAFEAQFPKSSSVYADEGTLAHAICEIYARRKFDPGADKSALTKELAKLKRDKLYNPEMLDTAKAYVEYLTEKSVEFDNPPHIVQEIRVDFSDYVPAAFGTCDCVMIGAGRLHITDYKHGKGVKVEAVGNPQMRLYALGALNYFSAIYGGTIKTVSMGICQPRISENCPEESMTVEELRAWGESIKPLAQAAYNGTGTYKPGAWCMFCRGKAQCKARARANTALEDFKDCIPAAKADPETAMFTPEQRNALGLPNLLTNDDIGDLLTRGADLVAWYNDLKDYALEAILNGEQIAGYKAVEGRSIREFKDADAAFKILTENSYDENMLYERKPKTLSAIEKMIGKKEFSRLLSEQVVKPAGKPTLAPESDSREPYSRAAQDFAGVVNE